MSWESMGFECLKPTTVSKFKVIWKKIFDLTSKCYGEKETIYIGEVATLIEKEHKGLDEVVKVRDLLKVSAAPGMEKLLTQVFFNVTNANYHNNSKNIKMKTWRDSVNEGEKQILYTESSHGHVMKVGDFTSVVVGRYLSQCHNLMECPPESGLLDESTHKKLKEIMSVQKKPCPSLTEILDVEDTHMAYQMLGVLIDQLTVYEQREERRAKNRKRKRVISD